MDAPHKASGPSDVAGVYEPPYYEWANLSDVSGKIISFHRAVCEVRISPTFLSLPLAIAAAVFVLYIGCILTNWQRNDEAKI